MDAKNHLFPKISTVVSSIFCKDNSRPVYAIFSYLGVMVER